MKLLLVVLIVNIFALDNVLGKVLNSKAVKFNDLQQLESDVRIIGGNPAEPGQFPWQVLVNFTRDQRSFYCGGSLISDEWILTAAQCVEGASSFSIRLGSINSGGNDDTLQIISSTYAIHHEQYNNFQNDIGLIRLSHKANINQHVKPIELDETNIPAGNDLTIIGFGAVQTGGAISQRLNYVAVKSISNQRCMEFYTNIITDSVMCTLGNTIEGACSGDGGGPLIRYVNGSPRHVGISIFISNAGCELQQPSGYTRTASFREWIRSKTGV